MTSSRIRDGVFETNSSSSHSVTVAENDLHSASFPPEMLKSGRIEVKLGSYGWEWHRYYKPENKLAYLLSQIANNHASVLEICGIVEKHTGCRVVIDPESRNGAYVEEGAGWEVMDSPDRLMGFLLSAGSYVQTGNDNSGPGEMIRTDRGDETFHVHHYVEEASEEGRVRIRFDCDMKDVLVESDGTTVEASIGDFWARYDVRDAMDGLVILSATVSPSRTGEKVDPSDARDFLHSMMEGAKPRNGEDGLRIVRNAPVETGPAPEGPAVRRGNVRYDTDATFDLVCAAPPETIAKLFDTVDAAAKATTGMRA